MLVLVPIYSEVGNSLTEISPLRHHINIYETEFNEEAALKLMLTMNRLLGRAKRYSQKCISFMGTVFLYLSQSVNHNWMKGERQPSIEAKDFTNVSCRLLPLMTLSATVENQPKYRHGGSILSAVHSIHPITAAAAIIIVSHELLVCSIVNHRCIHMKALLHATLPFYS